MDLKDFCHRPVDQWRLIREQNRISSRLARMVVYQFPGRVQGGGCALKDSLAQGLFRIYRQALAANPVRFGPIAIQNLDLQRVVSITQIVDGNKPFYVATEDELVDPTLQNLEKYKQEISAKRIGVWADKLQERLVQIIIESIDELETSTRRLNPMPSNHHCSNFWKFEYLLIRMRMKVWAAIAVLKLIHGNVVNPIHLPTDTFQITQSKF